MIFNHVHCVASCVNFVVCFVCLRFFYTRSCDFMNECCPLFYPAPISHSPTWTSLDKFCVTRSVQKFLWSQHFFCTTRRHSPPSSSSHCSSSVVRKHTFTRRRGSTSDCYLGMWRFDIMSSLLNTWYAILMSFEKDINLSGRTPSIGRVSSCLKALFRAVWMLIRSTRKHTGVVFVRSPRDQ